MVFTKNIGSGFFGSVYQAEYDGEVCAAKILNQAAKSMLMGSTLGTIQDAALGAFVEECSRLEKLGKHINVVQHISTAIDPKFGLPVLVMELMDCSLKQFILDYRPLNLSLQFTICHGVSSGLHYLHSNNIIHRDLCDDNILLTRPPDVKVKISDFGMSRILDYESMSASWTAVGHRQGYLPPEGSEVVTEEGKAHYSHRLDIFSFGAIATQTVQSAEHFQRRNDLRRTFKKIPEEHPLKAVITKCIETNSKKRQQAIADVCKDIAALFEIKELK